MSLPLRITFDQELGSPAMEIHVEAGHIRCEIHIPDATKPVPLEPADRPLMVMIRAALLRAGAPRGMLASRHGAYFLWCLAQHVKHSMEAEGPTVLVGELELARSLPPPRPGRPYLREIVVVE